MVDKLVEKWFPSSYMFRLIRTTFITEPRGNDYLCVGEIYEIIKSWDDRGKCFGRHLKSGGHKMALPEYGHDNPIAYINYSYEIQRRPSENSDAKWTSLGYLRPNCNS